MKILRLGKCDDEKFRQTLSRIEEVGWSDRKRGVDPDADLKIVGKDLWEKVRILIKTTKV
jgi:hypothetical protein